MVSPALGARFALPLWGKRDPGAYAARGLSEYCHPRAFSLTQVNRVQTTRAERCRVNAAKIDSNVEVWVVFAIEHLWLGFLEL